MHPIAENNSSNPNLQDNLRRRNVASDYSRKNGSAGRQSSDTDTEISFTENTTIHGIRYLAEQNRPFYEKIFWSTIMTFVCFWMVKTIANQIRNYLNNPVLMNIDGSSIQITDIPFPALTFCSENQVHPSFVNITDLFNKQNLTDDEYEKLEIGLTLCSELKLNQTFLVSQKNKTMANFTGRLRLYGTGNCRRVLKRFLWEQKPIPKPCEYFQMTMTPLGICYTFNMLPPKQLYTEDYYNEYKEDLLMLGVLLQDYKYFDREKIWDLESGYTVDEIQDGDVPWTLSSMKFQLVPVVIFLNFNADDMDPLCVTAHTFTVAIHNPAEPPTAYSTLAQAVTDRGNYIKITPKVVTTSKELQSWSPKARGCYFNDEKKLKFFKIYTMHNCEIECETNITLKKCNCTLFNQPHYHSTPTCRPHEMQCFKESLVQTLNSKNSETNNCDCLPSCTELNYDIDYFNVPDKFMDFSDNGDEKLPRNSASFYALYKTTRIKSVQRVAVVITSDIIANIGGLMGLFLGFSVLSIFETVFFFMNWVIRIFNILWK